MFTDENIGETPNMSPANGLQGGDTYKGFTYQGFTYNNQ